MNLGKCVKQPMPIGINLGFGLLKIDFKTIQVLVTDNFLAERPKNF